MDSMRNRLTLAMTVLVLGGALATAAPAQEKSIENRLREVEARFQEARAQNWHLYAPETYAEAEKNLKEARKRFRQGGEIEEIREELNEALNELAEAEQYAEIGQLVLKSAIAARSDALTAGAPDHALEKWEEAKEDLHEAGRDIEQGDHKDARKEASEAESEFRAAEFKAIRVALLGAARQAKEAAEEAGAEEKAPRTWEAGKQKLQSAEAILQDDRYRAAEAREKAETAAEIFEHATYIAGLVDEVEAEKPGRFEQLLFRHENILAEVAEVLNLQVDFSAGIARAGTMIIAGVRSLEADRDNLRRELRAVNARADSLDRSLARLQQREQATTAAMRAEKQRQARVRRLRELFPADEATVLQQGDELICRLYGLSFPVGSAEIQPKNFPLLTRIQKALRIFPEAKVVVEGHTDAAGDDDVNQRLSRERAQAVKAYLVANMPEVSSRISARGYGESSPLASNDTAEGRAKNRRIDIRLTDPYGGQEVGTVVPRTGSDRRE